jgi:hypothetical protein
LTEKIRSTFYLPPKVDREVRIKAAQMGIKYPSEFIEMLWSKFKKLESFKQGNKKEE